MKNLMGLILISGLMTACAHHNDVRPGPNGIHKVEVSAEDSRLGSRDAIEQANHFCKESGRHAAFLSEKKKYTGDMDEKKYKNAKRISKVAESVGSSVWVFGGKKESNIGGIIGLGGAASDEALGDGYTVRMRFKCI